MVPPSIQRVVAFVEANGFHVIHADGRPGVACIVAVERVAPRDAERLRPALTDIGVDVGFRRGSNLIGRPDRYVLDREPGATVGHKTYSDGRVETVTHTNGFVALLGISDADLA